MLTFVHDFLLGVGLLVQDAQLVITVNEHDACVVAILHSPLILLHPIQNHCGESSFLLGYHTLHNPLLVGDGSLNHSSNIGFLAYDELGTCRASLVSPEQL